LEWKGDNITTMTESTDERKFNLATMNYFTSFSNTIKLSSIFYTHYLTRSLFQYGDLQHEELHVCINETGTLTTEKQDHFIIPHLLL